MRLVVAGATGRTGLRVLEAARSRCPEVLALVRDPSRLEGRGGVEVAVGDVRDVEFLRRTLRADDVVVSALGSSGPADGDVVARGTEALIEAMVAVGARRFLGVVGAGILLTEGGVPRHSLPDYPPQFRKIGAQHQAALAACERSPLSWVLVGCPRIIDADATGRLSERVDHLPPGLDRVTTGDLAELLTREALAPTMARGRLGVNQAG